MDAGLTSLSRITRPVIVLVEEITALICHQADQGSLLASARDIVGVEGVVDGVHDLLIRTAFARELCGGA
jgi:hypothetical protein